MTIRRCRPLARELKAATRDPARWPASCAGSCRAIVAASGANIRGWAEARRRAARRIPVYRSDYLCLSSGLPDWRSPQTVSAAPELAEPLEILARPSAPDGEPAARLQQMCGAGDGQGGGGLPVLPRSPAGLAQRGRRRPGAVRGQRRRVPRRACDRGAAAGRTTMTTLSTHDTKRGEDVRARIGVLSQMPALWAEFVDRLGDASPSPDPRPGSSCGRTSSACGPSTGAVTAELRERLHGYAEKAIREAGDHTTWNEPDTELESAVHAVARRGARRPDVAAELTELVAGSTRTRRSDALGQKLLAAHRPRRARRLPGHRAVGGQPGRPGQPATGRLRRARRADAAPTLATPQDAGHRRGAAAAARPARHLPGRRLHAAAGCRAGRRARRRVRSRRGRRGGGQPAGRCGLPKSGWGDTALDAARRSVDRPADRWPFERRGAGSPDLFGDLPVALLERADD